MSSPSRNTLIRPYLFGFAFLLGLFLRFLHLGIIPLTDTEARWALQALAIARGDQPILGGQPGYLVLTAINFFIFGGSDLLARFWPALVGSGLILVPIAFQKNIGVKAAIILSFALALDPGLLAISRAAGSPVLAISFTAMCLAAWHSNRTRSAGFFGGMALLSGPTAWFGVLGLLIYWILFKYVIKTKEITEIALEETDPAIADTEISEAISVMEVDSSIASEPRLLRTALTWGIGTILLAGTLFLIIPAGLSSWADSLVDFFRGWGTIFLIKPGFLITALLISSFMPLVYVGSHFSSGRFKDDPVWIHAFGLCLIFFLLALFYPAHQVSDLGWMLIPMWIVAAIEIDQILAIAENQKLGVSITSVITFIFLVFFWENLISIPTSINNSLLLESPVLLSLQKFMQSLGLLVNGMLLTRILIWLGALLLLIMALLMVATIWDKKIAKIGSNWGSLVALLFYTISTGIGMAGLRIPPSAEMWQPGPKFAQADLLEKTIQDISEWNNGHSRSLDISILSNFYTPGVAWLLRDWPVTVVDALSPASSPSLIILPQGVEATLSSQYRKQNFVYMKTPLWSGLSVNGWLKWLTIREIPEQNVNLVLWARDDLFTDTGLDPSLTTP